MELLKNVTGKVAGGVVALGVIVSGISWWRMDEGARRAILDHVEKIAGWAGIVLLLPWATFFLIGRVASLDKNAAGAALVAGYTIAETVVLAWLFGWHLDGPAGWTLFVVGVLIAGVYNLFTCDWIAEKL